MRIVLITGDQLEHRYVANRLISDVELSAIVVDHGKPESRQARLRRYRRRYSPGQIVSRIFLVLLRNICLDSIVRPRTLRRIFGSNCSAFQRSDLLCPVFGINSPDATRTIADLRPDVILVFGTGIVSENILSQARTIALNLHTGISPLYRGADCTFWPVHNSDLDMLGATVHECTKEVDGGRIFGTTKVQLQLDDNLFAIFARCVVAGAELYVQKVRRLVEEGLEGQVQDLSVGREYKAFMRGIKAEVITRYRVRAGLIRRFVQSRRGPEV